MNPAHNPRPTRLMHPRLPIFRQDEADHSVLYTAGQFVVVDRASASALQHHWTGSDASLDAEESETAAWLEHQAGDALAARRAAMTAPYRPQCLTLYLSNACELDCIYCFSAQPSGDRNSGTGSSRLDLDAVRAAASLVMDCCSEKHTAFNLALQGGGEPTLRWKLIEQVVTLTKGMAAERGIGWHGYIATNGILSPQRAAWLARQFDRVGISCDGPPGIQERQRPRRDGKSTSAAIKRSAAAIKQNGGTLEVRSTITPQSMTRQVEIVSYLIETLGATSIRFEPVYVNPNLAQSGFSTADADPFVAHFLKAQETAVAAGCSLSYAGIRPQEVHGAYCDILRDVLRLTPDGRATACFLCVDGEGPIGEQLRIGAYDAKRQRFVLDYARIDTFKSRAHATADACRECINVLHCAGACPDRCGLVGSGLGAAFGDGFQAKESATFKCLMQQRLMGAWLNRLVTQSLAQSAKPPSYNEPRTYPQDVVNALQALSRHMDTKPLEAQWRALAQSFGVEKRSMPRPLWHERGLGDDGAAAWDEIRHHRRVATTDRPLSSYVHIPFCQQKCGFCDCHALAAGRDRLSQERRYVEATIADMDHWRGTIPANRRMTTVHFGGGTPNSLDPALFERLVGAYRERFRTTPDTEWALESTSRLLSETHLRFLHDLGFRRLHVGVQTLEEPLRYRLGRKDRADAVLEKLQRALTLGFITSVDLIYGIPGQSISGFMDTVQWLIELGIHGVSLYHLNHSRRNRRFFATNKPGDHDPVNAYFLFLGAGQLLLQNGYRKNHFAHFSLSRDRNLYYTHAVRGEDLLAFGASADGVIDHYLYRYPEYADFMRHQVGGRPALEGGTALTVSEQKAMLLKAALMHGRLRDQALEKIAALGLLDRWQQAALVSPVGAEHGYTLTGNGSWLVSKMIADVEQLLRRADQGMPVQ